MSFLSPFAKDQILGSLIAGIIPSMFFGFTSFVAAFIDHTWWFYLSAFCLVWFVAGFIAIFFVDSLPLPSPLASAGGQDKQDDN